MPAIDDFANFTRAVSGPVVDQFDVTPNDGVDLPNVTRAVMVTTSGVIKATWKGGNTSVTVELTAGVMYPFRLARIWSDQTTATGIKGLV